MSHPISKRAASAPSGAMARRWREGCGVGAVVGRVWRGGGAVVVRWRGAWGAHGGRVLGEGGARKGIAEAEGEH